jgi:hypothetical protein
MRTLEYPLSPSEEKYTPMPSGGEFEKEKENENIGENEKKEEK